jgi:hypothetical protein
MAINQLDTENADRDLTSLVTVLTHTPSATENTLCQGYIKLGDGLKDLDGSGGNFNLVITVGGQTVQASPEVIVFGTDVRSSIWTEQFPVPANEEVLLRVLSPNGADTDVDVTAYLFDIAPNVTLADGAHGGTSAVLTAERIIVSSTVSDQPALKLTGNGAGGGAQILGGTGSGDGLFVRGGSLGGSGIVAYGPAGGDGMTIQAQNGQGGVGLYVDGDSDGIVSVGQTGIAIDASDGISGIWEHIIEVTGSITAEQILRAVLAFVAGDRAGGGTATISFKRADGSTNAILMQSVDADGNTTSITLDLT